MDTPDVFKSMLLMLRLAQRCMFEPDKICFTEVAASHVRPKLALY